ncbi:MAG TPA: hypothetical protein VJJ81_00655 [Candidatus Babeliales bacterium]|nr:hypothetical protein [Candidatus Babeliales bacterium]
MYYKSNLIGLSALSLLFFLYNRSAEVEIERAVLVDIDTAIVASEPDASCLEMVRTRYGSKLHLEWNDILSGLGLTEHDLDLTDADNLALLNNDVLLGYRDPFGVIDRAWSLITKIYGCAEVVKEHVGVGEIGDFSVEIARLLRDTLEKCGVASERVVLCDQSLMRQKSSMEQSPFAVYTDRTTPDKHYLFVNRDICSDVNMRLSAEKMLYHDGYGIEAHNLLEHLLRHEASHIFYNEILLQSLLQRKLIKKIQHELQFLVIDRKQAEAGLQQLKKTFYALNSFYEKRADILACLSGPDPLGYAQYMLNNVADGLYAYRKSADWYELIADLNSCS